MRPGLIALLNVSPDKERKWARCELPCYFELQRREVNIIIVPNNTASISLNSLAPQGDVV